jgi:hypothetical protein
MNKRDSLGSYGVYLWLSTANCRLSTALVVGRPFDSAVPRSGRGQTEETVEETRRSRRDLERNAMSNFIAKAVKPQASVMVKIVENKWE